VRHGRINIIALEADHGHAHASGHRHVHYRPAR
jgi:CopG family nickel-responsive transcriptional regulator